MSSHGNLKKGTWQIYLLAVTMYIIGVLMAVFGKYSVALEVIATLFLLITVGFNITLSIIWICSNKRHLRGAVIYLFFLIFSSAFLFLCYSLRLYSIFWITIFFAVDVAIIFIYELYKVAVVYYDIVGK